MIDIQTTTQCVKYIASRTGAKLMKVDGRLPLRKIPSLHQNYLKLLTKLLLRFEKDFNKYLKNVGLPEVDFIKPIGSGSWYEDDIINQPDKVYGDIDYMVSYPLLGISSEERKDEIETNKTYNSEMLKFVQTSNLPYIDEKKHLDLLHPEL